MNQIATKHIRIKDYTYELPDARIAKHPVEKRDECKMLVWQKGEMHTDVFKNLTSYIKAPRLMIFNNTRVIFARLHFQKPSGAQIEIFCLEPMRPKDYQESFAARSRVEWICLIGNAKKWKEGRLEKRLVIEDHEVYLYATKGCARGSGFEVKFEWSDESITYAEILDAIGELPIPPYLNRQSEYADREDYQTVYSKIKGSVAAPTAGLHFTNDVLTRLKDAGVELDEVTLHVGAGTFKPVKTEEIDGHTMHAEWLCVKKDTIRRLLEYGGECVAVGTTSVRTLESLYYIGVQVKENPAISPDSLFVSQWLPYEYAQQCPEPMGVCEALSALLNYMEKLSLDEIQASTQIIIAPGYEYKIVKAMITNFHQPQSTLLLLVSAFVGGHWREIYDYALENDYRFLSYGDSCLLVP